MSYELVSFLSWTGLMVLAIVVLIITDRRSRGIDQKCEEVASEALPEIGKVAEKKHRERFGRAPTSNGAWYPGKPDKKIAEHA